MRFVCVHKGKIYWYETLSAFENGKDCAMLDFFDEDSRRRTFNWLAGLEEDDDGKN